MIKHRHRSLADSVEFWCSAIVIVAVTAWLLWWMAFKLKESF